MPLMDEASADGTRTGVQVFVAAPDGEIGINVVQGMRHVADGVREVESGHASGAMCRLRNSIEVECLPRPVLHARPEDERNLAAMLLEVRFDRFLWNVVRPAGGDISTNASLGSSPRQAIWEATAWRSEEKAPASMRMRRLWPLGSIERRQQQVQVDRERVHRHDLGGASARETRETVAEILVIRNPRPPGVLVPENCEPRPIVQLLEDQPTRGQRHQSKRVPAQIHERVAASIARQSEPVAKGVQRVRLVETAGELQCGLVIHDCGGKSLGQGIKQRPTGHGVAVDRRHLQLEEIWPVDCLVGNVRQFRDRAHRARGAGQGCLSGRKAEEESMRSQPSFVVSPIDRGQVHHEMLDAARHQVLRRFRVR